MSFVFFVVKNEVVRDSRKQLKFSRKLRGLSEKVRLSETSFITL